MKLHWSPRSPFVRKVMVVAHELGIVDRLTLVRTVVAMEKPHLELIPDNPLIKLPTLVLDDGTSLYDSPVISEYFDTMDGRPRLHPSGRAQRFQALRRQALGDGLLDMALLWRYENLQPKEQQRQKLLAAFRVKLDAVLAALERETSDLAATPFNIGHIAIGCGLSYLDFRLPEEQWRNGHPALAAWHADFAARPSMKATDPVDDWTP
jgi:glutathione S-transferase